MEWLDSAGAPRSGTAVVPGCGRGHEVLALAARGVSATGLDFAPSAVAAARAAAERAGLGARARFVQVDVFAAPDLLGVRFDLALEHTCYCAIDTDRRDEYVDVLHRLLRPGGRLVALLYAHDRPGGPPFGTTEGEVRRRFSRRFELDRLEPARGSVPSRAGHELLMVARARIELATQGL